MDSLKDKKEEDGTNEAYIYVRVSTKIQKESMTSQLNRTREYCEKNKYKIMEEVCEERSGKSVANRRINELIERMKNKSKLILDSMDRLSRNMTECNQLVDKLEGKRCDIHCLKQNFIYRSNAEGGDQVTKRMMLGMFNMLAENEINTLALRVKEGIKSKREKGLIWERAPYGYRKSNDGRYIIKLPAHNLETIALSEIMRLRECEDKKLRSYAKIAKYLTGQKLPRPQKKYIKNEEGEIERDEEGNKVMNGWGWWSVRKLYEDTAKNVYKEKLPPRGYEEPEVKREK